MDKYGNVLAQEGCTRCPCGAKYWEFDRCVSCGAEVPEEEDPREQWRARHPLLARRPEK